MDGTHGTRPRGQMRTNAEVQQNTKMDDMDYNSREVETSLDFYLNYLEAQVRCELKDSEARLTQSRYEGRVHLEIKEDLLANFLDELQKEKEDKEWSREKKLLQREIRSLKAKLDEAQAKHPPQRDIENLKAQLRKISAISRYDLQQQTFNTRDIQVRLEQIKGENEALQNELQEMKVQLRAEKHLCAVAENNLKVITDCLKVQLLDKDIAEFEARSKAEQLEKDLVTERAEALELQKKLSKMAEALLQQEEEAKKTVERCQASYQAKLEEHRVEISKITAAVKKAKGLLETEHLHFQQEKTSFQESRASHVAQLDEQRHENNKLVAALKEAEQQLETEHLLKSSLLEELEKFRGIYLAQLKMQEEENKMFVAALKTAEHQAESDRLQWQQEKTSLLDKLQESRTSFTAQLDEQKQENHNLVAALKEAEQQLESHREPQEEKSSLLQAIEGGTRDKQPEQDQEEEQEVAGCSTAIQQEDPESQIPKKKKKKKKKWYRKLF